MKKFSALILLAGLFFSQTSNALDGVCRMVKCPNGKQMCQSDGPGERCVSNCDQVCAPCNISGDDGTECSAESILEQLERYGDLYIAE